MVWLLCVASMRGFGNYAMQLLHMCGYYAATMQLLYVATMQLRLVRIRDLFRKIQGAADYTVVALLLSPASYIPVRIRLL